MINNHSPIEEHLKTLADTAPGMIWIADTKKHCYFFNKRWLKYTGCNLEEEIAMDWASKIHPDDLLRFLDIYSSSFDAREEFKIEYRLKRHDGKYLWIITHAVPHYNTNNEFLGYKSSSMDIDELLESKIRQEKNVAQETLEKEQVINEELAATNEELQAVSEEQAATVEELQASNLALQQSRESLNNLNLHLENKVSERTQALKKAQQESTRQRDQLKTFFMQAPAAICILDGPDLVFEMVNPLYQQFFPNRELLYKPLLEALPELKETPIMEVLQNVYQTGETYEGNELMIPFARTANGPNENRYFNFTYQARYNQDKEVDGILAFAIEVTESVINRKKIEESATSLKNLVMTAHYSLMILRGEDYVVEIANQQLANLWGKSLENITGKKLMDILPELEGQPFPALLKQVFDTGKPYGQEEEIFHLVTSDGPQLKYISFYYDPMFDGEGKVTGIIVAAEDITNQVQSRLLLEQSNIEQQALNQKLVVVNEEMAAINEELEAANEELIDTQDELHHTIDKLGKSESKFRSLVQHAPVAIAIFTGVDLIMESVNDQMLRLIGKKTDVIGQKFLTAVPEIADQPFPEILRNVLETGEIYYGKESEAYLEHEGVAKKMYFNFIYQPIKEDSGETHSIMIVAMDVTEQVTARKKVELAEENLRMATESAELGNWSLNLVDQEFFFSPKLKEIFGFAPDAELAYDSLINQVMPGYKELIPGQLDQGIENGKPIKMEYPIYRNGDGEIRWIRSIGKVMDNDNSKPSFITGISQDVTEQKQDEIRKNDFIGMVSHELKTPLTSLTAIVQLANAKIKKNNEDAFLAGAMDKANMHVKKMSKMINGFLNISRLESGKLMIIKQPFDLENLLVEMIEEVVVTTSSHSILHQKNNPVIVNADREKIGSVISNLLSNAIKYSPKGKTITVQSELDGNFVNVSIKDEGIGIKPQDAKKIFERYYRVENEDTKHISGFGIGLYLSAEIINRHEGKIWVESEMGEGATFFFKLPIA